MATSATRPPPISSRRLRMREKRYGGAGMGRRSALISYLRGRYSQMMFSTKAEYGVRVMVALARHDGDAPVSLSEIADEDGLPLAYLEHLVARLRKAGLVDSRRGARGGYL